MNSKSGSKDTYHSKKYIAAIDGLRAFAIIAVIINHFSETILPGGYLGVDIFFVISGFVITQSLVAREEKNIGSFLIGFYKRRIKRLTPALFFCFIITSFLISFFNPAPNDYIKTGFTSIFGFSNIKLYLDSIAYWGNSASLNPFTHTWSLGVEEQFYFVFPFLLWSIVRGKWNPIKLGYFQKLIVGLSIVSLFIFIYFYNKSPEASYYITLFRFWELGAGCMLYLLVKNNSNIIKYFRLIPDFIYVIALITIMFIPNEYPVYTTFAAVFTTTLLISTLTNQSSNTFYQSMLSHRVIVYIGVISYSLYLWHWVVLVISRWTIGIHWWSIPFQVSLILILGIISYKFIEKPFRNKNWSSLNKIQTYIFILILIVPIGLAASASNKEINILYTGSDTTEVSQSTRLASAKLNCTANTAREKNRQVIRTVGNSHANHIIPMLKIIGTKCNITIKGNKRPFTRMPSGNNMDFGKIDKLFSSLKKNDVLILSSRNTFLYQIPYLNGRGKRVDKSERNKKHGYGLDNWLMELDSLIEKAASIGVKIVLFLPIVEFDQQPINYAICKKEWFRVSPPECNLSVSKVFLNKRFSPRFFKEVREREKLKDNFHIFNPLPIYCGEGNECHRIVNGVIAFRDTNHLTPDGAQLMVENFYLFLTENQLIK
ncbi:MAG: acyltransferase family protein [Leptospirales bacterium]